VGARSKKEKKKIYRGADEKKKGGTVLANMLKNFDHKKTMTKKGLETPRRFFHPSQQKQGKKTSGRVEARSVWKSQLLPDTGD